MMKKENELLHKEYVELKTSIELLLKRRRILKNAVFPLIVIIFFVSVGLVKSAKEIPATAIFLIGLLGFVWVILITG